MEITDLMIRVSKVEIGECGENGTMGSNLTEITGIAMDSVMLSKDANELWNLEVEDSDTPILTVISKAGSFKASFGTNDLSSTNLELAFGGDTVTGTWSAPITQTILEKSVKITTMYVNGTAREISIPRASVSAAFNGELKRGAAASLTFECTVLTPVDADGDKLSPIQIATLEEETTTTTT